VAQLGHARNLTVVAAEEVAGAQRAALDCGRDHDRSPAGRHRGGLQQSGMGGEVGQPHVGQAALASPCSLALRRRRSSSAMRKHLRPHDGEPRFGGLAERLPEQQAGRLFFWRRPTRPRSW
jgi:hypothetical protein